MVAIWFFLTGVKIQKALDERSETVHFPPEPVGPPVLRIEVGNGIPWDLPDFRDRRVKLVGIHNLSDVQARNCHTQVIGLNPFPEDGHWMNHPDRDRTLEPDETAFTAIGIPDHWRANQVITIQTWTDGIATFKQSFRVILNARSTFPKFSPIDGPQS